MAKRKTVRLYQVMIEDVVKDIQASEPFETVAEAQARLAEVRLEIVNTWENPDPDAAYIHIITK